MNKELQKQTLQYLKENKTLLLETYLKECKRVEPNVVIFTAGASGAGKTEYALTRKENEPHLVHIDTDLIRDFFIPIGYNGKNASTFQRASSKGVDILYKEAINKGYSIILDTNFSNFSIATININKALKHKYIIKIVYILQDIEKSFEFAKKREHITKRAVPKEVVYNSFKKSFETVIQIKEIFQDNVNIILVDRIHNQTIENINSKKFFEIVGKELP